MRRIVDIFTSGFGFMVYFQNDGIKSNEWFSSVDLVKMINELLEKNENNSKLQPRITEEDRKRYVSKFMHDDDE